MRPRASGRSGAGSAGRSCGCRQRIGVNLNITMSLETWLGLRNDPARLEGWGLIPAETVRALIDSAGVDGSWRCAIVDGDHGTLLGLGKPLRASGYHPTKRLADFVRTAEPTCVFPGCGVAARRCDLDHRIPYPAGETCSCNMSPQNFSRVSM